MGYRYPECDGGWTVYCRGRKGRFLLFCKGKSNAEYYMSFEFVVRDEDATAFIEEKLEYLLLDFREYNDFITYWLSKMKNNFYNLISF